MKLKVGATIVVEAESVAQTQRKGVIEEVLSEDPARLRVRWDDGRESIFSPAAGAATIEAKQQTKSRK
jgi:hypothetical protein